MDSRDRKEYGYFLMKKIVFISDFFSNQIVGGGELNDKELIDILKTRNTIKTINSHLVDQQTIEYYDRNGFVFLISNFFNLSEETKTKLLDKKYLIYEHDHKYLSSRNPAHYSGYVAPKKEIINYDFYRNAIAVLVQSQLHKDIMYSNLEINNIHNLSGNLWSEQILEYMSEINKNPKKDTFAVLHSDTPHKNTKKTIFYCKQKNIQYELIADKNHNKFLLKLSSNKGLIFFPLTPETLSRICVEAKMLNMEVITTKTVGATGEDWFSLRGTEMISFVRNMRNTIPNKVLEFL
jgi:hypothetical protein